MDVKVVSEKGISRDTNNFHDNDKVSVKCLSDFYLTGGLRPDRYPTVSQILCIYLKNVHQL